MQMRNPINQVSGWKMKTAPLSEICVGSLFVGIQTVPCVTETARPSSNVIKEPAPLSQVVTSNQRPKFLHLIIYFFEKKFLHLSFAIMNISFLINL